MIFYIPMNSQWGPLLAAISDQGTLHGLWFEGQKHFPKLTQTLTENDTKPALPQAVIGALNELQQQLDAYQNGTLQTFTLHLAPIGTDFQTHVWECLTEIPHGQTTTYKALGQKVAQKMGRTSMSAQAIGQAVGRNPISIVIPCHRVIGTNGTLTGYAGGLDKKNALLTHEANHR